MWRLASVVDFLRRRSVARSRHTDVYVQSSPWDFAAGGRAGRPAVYVCKWRFIAWPSSKSVVLALVVLTKLPPTPLPSCQHAVCVVQRVSAAELSMAAVRIALLRYGDLSSWSVMSHLTNIPSTFRHTTPPFHEWTVFRLRHRDGKFIGWQLRNFFIPVYSSCSGRHDVWQGNVNILQHLQSDRQSGALALSFP